jgi:hypothetical protein
LGHFIEVKFVAIFGGAYWAQEQGAHHHVGREIRIADMGRLVEAYL